ncbi:Antibiotic biosynthesis monooxygenase [Exiguobacterium sibiricum 255-15]|uniref:Antibiotic biosynthesis monooxygenase n=1 Tax=Exiguobacterium sibiricum (strain DSM 17290 / CCUG 55495 / CIP 109462 / JCM 13490 / 255-15) TaxID=262543 RepID=B1YFC5_EXIS2|nr:putative quinol monooxygenase [Exiguobacterium sibiricum]ACB60801.1 Antibiotic biosynthesis monooxygenase [Exiguobacterium sibiricum 255-15]
MIQLIARIKAHPGQAEQLAHVIEGVILPSRAESGCLTYQAHRAKNDTHVFYFYEQWRDQKAFDDHVASAHYQTYRTDSANLVSDRSLTFLQDVSK